jgi:hypothetical protein
MSNYSIEKANEQAGVLTPKRPESLSSSNLSSKNPSPMASPSKLSTVTPIIVTKKVELSPVKQQEVKQQQSSKPPTANKQKVVAAIVTPKQTPSRQAKKSTSKKNVPAPLLVMD